MKPVPSGARLDREVVPGEADTAAAIGNQGIGAISTSALIAGLEQTSHLVVAPYYDAGEATVGVHIELEHVAPAVPGRPMVLTAELTAQKGRRVEFAVAAAQDGRETARGRHARIAVLTRRFEDRLARLRAGADHPDG